MAAGRSARAPAVRDRRDRSRRSRCAPADGSARSRSRTRRGGRSPPTAATRCSCCTRSPATVTRRAASSPATSRSAGGTRSSGPGRAIDTDQFFVVCPNVLGGCQGTTGPSSIDPETGRPYGSRFPTITIRDQIAVEAAARRRARASSAGRRSWAARWAGSARSSGRSTYPERVPHAVIIACGAAATAEQIGLCSLQIRAIEDDPNFHGGDYYDAEDGPWRGLSLARGIGQVSYRTELELAQRFNRGHQNDEHPVRGRAVHRSSRTSSTTARSSPAASTPTRYIVLSRVMNHHDVGRGRSGVRGRARPHHRPGHDRPASPPTGSTRCACRRSWPS